MAKFCTSCGAPLNEGSEFCTSCGAAQGSSAPASTPGGANPQQNQGGMNMSNITEAAGAAAHSAADAVKNTFDGVSVNSVKNAMNVENIKNVGKTKDKNVIIGLCAAAAALILIIVIVCSMVGKPYTKPVDNLFKAFTKADGSSLEKALPDYMNEYIEEMMEKSDKKYDSVAEYYEDGILESTQEELEDEYGDHVKITYKVKKKTSLKKSALNDIRDDADDIYDADADVTKGYELKLKVTIKGSDDKDTKTVRVKVFKINGKWCVADFNSLDLDD